ncbi:hypothetical protein PGTUg99_027092 [Puccinia graminis f. sp. tritici]|uniref:BED-type domain-containing protein n=1 Tax=Puccinia graminis f. sp. tritici TaxID=56615 RepID=A0A5B0SN71_PUCGR|nr:hypothetical protein PGTUg99_027092 [Puccinia graminis f. sp. tritici]
MKHRPRKKVRRDSSPPSSSATNPNEFPAPSTQAEESNDDATQSARAGLTPRTDQEELSVSSSYASYDTPELSNQLDKNGRRMIAYPCKMCGTRINRPMTDSSCSNLLKHAAGCLKKKTEKDQTRSLASLGVSGTGEVDVREVSSVQQTKFSFQLIDHSSNR